MNPIMYLLINGINTLRSDDAWNNKGEIILGGWRILAHAFQYFSDTVFRRMFQNDRVKRLAALCRRYLDFELQLRLVGHSNGGDLICRLLKTQLDIKLDEIHLIAAAADHDCERNGINEAMRKNRLGKAYFYCSRNDEALQKAMVSKVLFGWLGLGYDYVGMVGPSNIAFPDRVKTIWRDELKHSDWVKNGQLEKTLKMVTNPCG